MRSDLEDKFYGTPLHWDSLSFAHVEEAYTHTGKKMKINSLSDLAFGTVGHSGFDLRDISVSPNVSFYPDQCVRSRVSSPLLCVAS